MESDVTTVQILGKSYQVVSDQNPEYVRKLADYVDRELSEVATATPVMSTQKVAVLACLNIADELVRTRNSKDQLARAVESRLQNTLRKVNERMRKER